MGTVIRDRNGTAWTTAEGRILSITEKYVNRTVVHDLPAANKDIIQNMGQKNRTFTIKGVLTYRPNDPQSHTIRDYASFFRANIGYTGSIEFFSAHETGADLLSDADTFNWVTQVYFSNITFEDRAGRPFERSFTLDLVEVL